MSLIEKLINRKSFLCIFSFSLSFDVVVSWFVVTGDDGSHLFIFTATLPQMHKHIHIQPQIHTPLLLRTKLTGHILGLRAPCGYILAVLGLESPLCLLSQLRAQLWQGHTAGILLYWMTEQHASIQLWVKGCGLWFGTKHIKIDYFSPLTAFFLRPSFTTDINQK